jgi:acetyltransferase-like isoleucine patch superfamily enzyme
MAKGIGGIHIETHLGWHWSRAQLKQTVKRAVIGIALACVFPFAGLSAFGRALIVFRAFAQLFALIPGVSGNYLRAAYYSMTLRECSWHSHVSFGSFISHSSSRIGHDVYVGCYCVLGSCFVGQRTQIADRVQIIGGRRQHRRDAEGQILGAEPGVFTPVFIGPDCRIGPGTIVMADVGAGTTIEAGAIVIERLPADIVAEGNPARVVKKLAP